MELQAIYTLGVFNRSEAEFFDVLLSAEIDTFVDIRQRRAVRGSKYSFVNATALQTKLHDLGIHYVHVKELAPSAKLRELQKEADRQRFVKNTNREKMLPAFIEGYKKQNLKDLKTLLQKIPSDAKRICFFCVEEKPSACHRSLAANFFARKLQIPVTHL